MAKARLAVPAALRAQAAALRAQADTLDGLADASETAITTVARPDEWLDARSCAPLSRRRVLSLVRSGALRSSRDGRRVLVRRSDLDAYLAGCATASPSAESAIVANDELAALRYAVARRARRTAT